MSTLPEIIDAAIVRDPKPRDVLVLRVAEGTTMEQVEMLRRQAMAAFECRVSIISGRVEVVSFTGDVA